MKRNHSIDLLRTLGALAVIIIHCVSSPVKNSAAADATLAATANAIHGCLLWAVPVFFMITGYCLLTKQECTYGYCFSHVKKYVAALFTVGLFYALLEEFFTARTVDLPLLLRALRRVFCAELWDHMWFVYAIIGIYLVMPALHPFLRQGGKGAGILTGLLFFFTIVRPFFAQWLPLGFHIPFGGPLFFVCFGSVLANRRLKRVWLYLCGVCACLCLVWICVCRQTLAYDHPAVCLLAISIFTVFTQMDTKPSPLLMALSGCTWAVYLIHPFFINVAIKVLELDVLSGHAFAKLPAFTVVITAVSFCGAFVLRKIPLIKKIF